MSIATPEFDVASLSASYEASVNLPDPFSGVGVPNTLHIMDQSQYAPDQYVMKEGRAEKVKGGEKI